jgi:hypothetical protein
MRSDRHERDPTTDSPGTFRDRVLGDTEDRKIGKCINGSDRAVMSRAIDTLVIMHGSIDSHLRTSQEVRRLKMFAYCTLLLVARFGLRGGTVNLLTYTESRMQSWYGRRVSKIDLIFDYVCGAAWFVKLARSKITTTEKVYEVDVTKK